MSTELKAGELVTIKVKNPIWPMRKAYASYIHIPEFNVFSGKVVYDHKAIKPDQVGLTTDDPRFDLRIIDKDRIVGLEHAVFADKVSTTPTNESWTVQGSNGSTYTVTLDRGGYECTCPGFQFRRSCKHVEQKKGKN